MKPKTNPFVVLTLVYLFLAISTLANKNPGIITGSIIQKENSKPVPYANVALLDNHTHQIVTGIISDANGQFTLENIAFNRYELQISFLGFEKKTINLQVNAQNNPLKIGRVILKRSAEQLDEVVVAEERLKGKQEVDRTIYTVNDKIQQTAKDGLDILKHIPGVSVDFQDNVTLEGTGNILYLVNDIPRDQQFVAQLNPGDFNKVEIITNPGVEYDADVDAVINIILKKRPKGGRGGLTLTLADPHKIASNHRGNIEYGGEKFRVFASDRLNYQSYKAYSKQKTRITNNGDITDFTQTGEGYASWLRNSTNYGIDFFINDKNTLNIYGDAYVYVRNQDEFNEQGTETINNELTRKFNLINDQKDIGRGLYNSLYYKHKFNDKGHQITSQFNYYNYKASGNHQYDYRYTYLDSILPQPFELSRNEETENRRNMFEWRNDYSRNIGKFQLKGGYWTYYQWFDNTFNSGASQEEQFQYNEFRQEAYASAASSLGKFQWSLGMRTAWSKSRIDKSATNTYLELLPQLSVMYPIKKGQSMRFTARRRIARPDMAQLNPFEMQTDSTTINTGNPDLKPEIINRAELQYSLNFRSNYIAPRLYLEYTTNSVQQSSYINPDGVSVLRPENVGKRYEYGLAITAAVNLTRWFRINAYASVYGTEVSDEKGYHETLWSSRLNGAAVLTPWEGKPYSFSAITQYIGPRLRYKAETTRDVMFLLQADAGITDNFKASVVFNPLSQNFKYEATERNDNNYYAYQEGRVDVSQLLMLTLSYNFSWGKTPKQLERSTEYESDGGNGLF